MNDSLLARLLCPAGCGLQCSGLGELQRHINAAATCRRRCSIEQLQAAGLRPCRFQVCKLVVVVVPTHGPPRHEPNCPHRGSGTKAGFRENASGGGRFCGAVACQSLPYEAERSRVGARSRLPLVAAVTTSASQAQARHAIEASAAEALRLIESQPDGITQSDGEGKDGDPLPHNDNPYRAQGRARAATTERGQRAARRAQPPTDSPCVLPPPTLPRIQARQRAARSLANRADSIHRRMAGEAVAASSQDAAAHSAVIHDRLRQEVSEEAYEASLALYLEREGAVRNAPDFVSFSQLEPEAQAAVVLQLEAAAVDVQQGAWAWLPDTQELEELEGDGLQQRNDVQAVLIAEAQAFEGGEALQLAVLAEVPPPGGGGDQALQLAAAAEAAAGSAVQVAEAAAQAGADSQDAVAFEEEALHQQAAAEGQGGAALPMPPAQQLAEPAIAGGRWSTDSALAVAYQASSRISRKVPKKAVGAWSEAATKSLRRVVASAKRKDPQGVYCKLLLEFLTLPRLLLSLGSRATNPKLRPGFADPVELSPDEQAELLAQPDHEPERQHGAAQDRTCRNINRLMAAGQLSDASRRVQAGKLAPANATTMAKLEALHPEGVAPQGLPEVQIGLSIDLDTLSRVVKGLRPEKASGPSKWTNEQLKAAFMAPNSKFPEVLLEFVNLATQGQLPPSQFLLASTLMALEKPNGGVRPIAVGEVLARVLGKCAMAMVAPSASAAFMPLQFGVCTDAANESVVNACRGFMQAEPEGVVFLADFKNAFNTVHRGKALKALAEEPEMMRLLPLAKWAYESPAPLLMRNEQRKLTQLESTSGVRQGDPLGPMLFAMALQPVLKKLQASHPTVSILAYLDDVVIMGKADDMPLAIHSLAQEAASIGLQLRADKCLVYNQDEAVAQALATEVECEATSSGFTILGSPLGSAVHVAAKTLEKVKDAIGWFDALDALPLNKQDKLLLARMSGSLKVNHLARCVDPAASLPALAEFSKRCQDTLAKIMEEPSLSEAVAARAHLPPRMGGVGFTAWSEALVSMAYFCGQCAAHKILTLTDTPRIMALSPLADAAARDPAAPARLAAVQQLKVLTDVPDVAHIAGANLNGLQKKCFDAHNAELHAHLLDQHRPGALSQPERASLRSASSGLGSAWLSAMPVMPTLRLSDYAVTFALRTRLSLPACRSTDRLPSCTCDNTVTDAATHALGCGSRGNMRGARHTLLLHAWQRIASKAGCDTVTEPPLAPLIQAEPGQPQVKPSSRADLLLCLKQGINRRMVLCDVTVVHPLGAGYLACAARNSGYAARVAQKAKYNKHPALKNCTQALFMPLAMETYGRAAPKCNVLLHMLAVNSSEKRPERATFLRQAYQELAVALVKGNAVCGWRGMHLVMGVHRDVRS